MKAEYTPVLMGLGLGTASVLAWRFKKMKPVLEFNDAVYERDNGKLRLTVSNLGKKAVYAKPILRKVIMPDTGVGAEGSSVLSFMPALRDGARTMYELISECSDPVEIPSGSSVELLFSLADDPEFNTADFLYVEAPCGLNAKNLSASVVKTIPIFSIDAELDVKTVKHKEEAHMEDLMIAEPAIIADPLEELGLDEASFEPLKVYEPMGIATCDVEDSRKLPVLESKAKAKKSVKKRVVKKPVKKKAVKKKPARKTVVATPAKKKTVKKKAVKKKPVKNKAKKKTIKKKVKTKSKKKIVKTKPVKKKAKKKRVAKKKKPVKKKPAKKKPVKKKPAKKKAVKKKAKKK